MATDVQKEPGSIREALEWLRKAFRSDAADGLHIAYRLELAGRTAKLFLPEAIEALGRGARGIPRIIDRIAEHSLLLALKEKKKEIDAEVITEAIDEVEP